MTPHNIFIFTLWLLLYEWRQRWTSDAEWFKCCVDSSHSFSSLFPFEPRWLSLHYRKPAIYLCQVFSHSLHPQLLSLASVCVCVSVCPFRCLCFWLVVATGCNFESIIRLFKMCRWTGNDDNDREVRLWGRGGNVGVRGKRENTQSFRRIYKYIWMIETGCRV